MEKLIIFARAPLAGMAKTRLAAELGQEAALDACKKLLHALVANLRSTGNVEVAFTPSNAEAVLTPFLPSSWRLHPQVEGPLDVRLNAAFERAFAQGASKAAIIGSDCPRVTPAHIREAFRTLGKADAVFGPAADGGFWLVALKAPHPELFREIPWSTEEVLARTLANAKSLGLRPGLLEILSDIDTAADWREWNRELKKPG